jgi:hypothetical protein
MTTKDGGKAPFKAERAHVHLMVSGEDIKRRAMAEAILMDRIWAGSWKHFGFCRHKPNS